MRSNKEITQQIRRRVEKVFPLARKAKNILSLGLEGKQWLACLMICAVLLSVFSLPVGGYAYSKNNNSDEFEPVNEKLSVWTEAWRDLNAKIESWTTPYRAENAFYAGDNDDKKKVDKKKGTNDIDKSKEKIGADKNNTEEKLTVSKSKKTLIENENKSNIENLAENVKKIETQLPSNIVIKVGQSIALTALPLDKKGNVVNGIDTDWQSSSEEILKLQNGQAFAIQEGLAKLTVKAGNYLKTFKVNIVGSIQESRLSPPLMPEDEFTEEERDSRVTPQNNLGSPYGQVEAQPPNGAAVRRNLLERPGSSNFSFDVPIASLSGRGIDAGTSLTYNSRVWNFWQNSLNSSFSRYRYNLDADWLAPGFKLGFGKISSINWNFCTIISPDGTAHQLFRKSGDTYSRIYESDDSSFMRLYTTHASNGDMLAAVLKYNNGTTVYYSELAFYKFFPTQITDKNGNIIQIAYKQNDVEGRIWYIKDTLNRYINFYYDSNNKLVTVTVPGYNNSSEKQTIRFYYETMNFNTSLQRFDKPSTIPASIQALKYVYFPGTQTGYKYEYSTDYGMIYKMSGLRGMVVSSANTSETGSVTNEGEVATSTTYNYPMTVTTPLTDVPNYTTRTDDWAGRTIAQPSITTYQVEKDTTNNLTKSKITSPDGTITETWAKIAPSQWDDGLVTDIFIKTLINPQLQVYKTWAHKKIYWVNQTGTSGRQNPRISKVESTNDAGQTSATSFEYDNYNNPTIIRDHDFASPGQLGTELERTEITYETNSNWTDRRLLSLPLIVRKIVNGATVQRTDFEYDNYGTNDSQLTLRNDIIMFDQTYNPASGYYDTNTKYRGNVTKITAFSDAALQPSDPSASITTVKYDIAGNAVETTLNCCNKLVQGYSKSTEYAYRMSETRGANGELTATATYDFNTGLVKTNTDVNNQVTNYTYDPNNLRQTRVDRPDGGYTTFEYQDGLVNGPNGLKWSYVKSTIKVDAAKEVSSWSYLDGRGSKVRSLGPQFNGEHQNVIDTEYNAMGQVARASNPYTATSFSSPINPSNNWTTPTYDPLDRIVLVTLPDGNTSQNEFNGTILTSTDQAGKKRRLIVNALARVIRTDEPDINGNLGDVNSPNQPTFYEYDGNGNLSKVTQTEGSITQERLFRYDSLSRLTHEKQVEETPTLDDNGVKNLTTGQWTRVYKYNTSGKLIEGVDARGVKTSLTYDALQRVKTVTYTGETGYLTPDITYTYDEERTGFFNKGSLTKVETAQETDMPPTSQVYDYDLMGRIKKHTQSVGTNNYTLEYGYNLAGQPISEKYPSGRTVSLQIDSIGRPSAISDAQRTYTSGYQYASHGGISSVNFGNGTVESFGYDSQRLQLTNQSLVKATEVIQKYEYGYGKVDLATGNLDATKNNGQLARIDSYIGGTTSNPTKQWQQRFDYDSLGRLREVRDHRGDTNALSYKYIFDFDRYGNLFRKSSSNPAAGQETPLNYQWIEDSDIDKTKNRFSSATGTQYDEAGNVTRDTKFRGLDYKYDANGRMVWSKLANNTGLDATSVYNGFGQRVATKVNDIWRMFVYDFSGKVVAEYGGLTPTDEGGIRYYMQDRQGSTSAILNQSGFVQSRFNYQAFGEEIGANIGMRTTAQGFGSNQSVRNKYALTERDEASGLDHTWWRKLENQVGRWTSPDPYKGSASLDDPQSFNRYAYVTNDPMNYADPTGLYEGCVHEAMTRFLGELAGLSRTKRETLAIAAGDKDERNSADGDWLRADSWDNYELCKKGEGPNVEIHFPSAAQLKINRRNYNRYIKQGDWVQAGHMLHSLQDGYGAHVGYSNDDCLGHAPSPTPDRILGDSKFIKAANETFRAMIGRRNRTLTSDEINRLIARILKECAGKYEFQIMGVAGARMARESDSYRNRRVPRYDPSREFDWLEIMYGMRRTIL